LVKNPNTIANKATIHYHDIGDYLSREEKLAIVKKFKSVGSKQMTWKTLQPNEHGDWLNQRNDLFGEFIPIADKSNTEKPFFNLNSNGIVTNRDAWVYNSSYNSLSDNMKGMIAFYNSEVERFVEAKKSNPDLEAKDFVSTDPKRIKWVQNLFRDAQNGLKLEFQSSEVIVSLYRPYFKQNLYKHRNFVWSPYLQNSFFPEKSSQNLLICTTGIAGTKEFTSLITDKMPDIQLLANGQSFPLYYYEEREKNSPSLFDAAGESEYIRRDGVSDFILERAKKIYGKNVGKEDIFYYVYGILHSQDYRAAFANDLKKMLPRIPLVEDVRDFWKFSKAGKKLAELHINYEEIPPYEGVEVSGESSGNFKVQKMRFPKKGQQDTIIYNSKIVVSNIPEKAYEYVVNGKSAIEWIMERYQVSTDKKSGIKNDPNDWAIEVGNPRYILDLLLSIINVSVQTVDIVNQLPKLDFSSRS
jgi:predicted helicase